MALSKKILKSLRQFDTLQLKKAKTEVKITPGMNVEIKDIEGQVKADQSELGEEQVEIMADLDQTKEVEGKKNQILAQTC